MSTLGAGLSGCGGSGGGGNSPSGQSSPDSADDTQTASARLQAAASAVPLLSFLAGNGEGFGATFAYPQGVAVSSKGVVYVADTDNHTIRRIDGPITVTTIAGSAGRPGSGESGDGQGFFQYPCGLAMDASDNLYVADCHNHTIRRIAADGRVSTLAGWAGVPGSEDGNGQAARFKLPYAVAVDTKGNVYVADSGNHTIRVIDAKGTVRTLAGLAGSPGAADGKGTVARFDGPRGIQVDADGVVYVTDRDNQTVRQITAGGVVSTWAGTPGKEGLQDGAAKEATFSLPCGLARDSKGALMLTELGHQAVRKVTPAGVVTTLAGKAGDYGHQDGVGAEARFYAPSGIAVDGQGNIYVGDSANQVVRKITPAGEVSTHAGQAGTYGYVDGPAASARFASPWRIAADSAGQVYVADAGSRTIRQISTSGVVSTLAGSTLSGFHAGSLPGSFDNCSGLAVRDGRLVFSTREGLAQISPLR
jgi:sugar lactone lactonase YvrE